ncbi:unnamed protein product [Eruca vesicaria subsp. sativa]|uniref:C2H2-type domain-containing protein n=1 Tax=Eruca vesicaria subsp. sativa TaxID=29727 RepID=A0ABC8KV87_ERUVS|nr:unnamed protein product [Eruca vesicaria subsp. sativa]
MEQQHQHLHKPIFGEALTNTHSRKEDETTHQKRDLSCSYGLRQNPKKTTHKSFELESSEPRKKILFRCGECGKGFRYEKCLSNHQAGMHLSTIQRVCEESIKSLCSSFSLVRRKKRSMRVLRYKKTSFTTFLESPSVFGENDEELEVAECLILLSKSSPKIVVDGVKLLGEAMDDNDETIHGFLRGKKLRKTDEFGYGVLRNEQKILEGGDSNTFDHQKQRRACEFVSGFSSYEAWKETVGFLGDKVELDQWKLAKSKLGLGAMKCSDADDDIVTETSKGDVEHQCRLCNKIFSSYQALGGHQTFHRMNKSKSKKSCREELVESEDDVSVKKEKKRQHKCSKLAKDGSCFKLSQ